VKIIIHFTLRSNGYPVTTQNSLPIVGQALSGGFGYLQETNERFQIRVLYLVLLSITSWRKAQGSRIGAEQTVDGQEEHHMFYPSLI